MTWSSHGGSAHCSREKTALQQIINVILRITHTHEDCGHNCLYIHSKLIFRTDFIWICRTLEMFVMFVEIDIIIVVIIVIPTKKSTWSQISIKVQQINLLQHSP